MSIHAAKHSTLVLICKRPLLGQGKQRLADSLGRTVALAIATALLDCALEDLQSWPGAIAIAPADDIDSDWAKALMPAAIIIAQGAGNLGERLQRVDQTLQRSGHPSRVFIGSDAPVLTVADYLAADRALREHDFVLTPARDGGVVLMGNCQPWPALADLPWSTAQLGALLDQRCREAGFNVARLAESFDIDEAADLQFCLAALVDDRRPARRRLAQLLATLPSAQESSDVESA